MDKIFEQFTINILKINKLVHKIKLCEAEKYGLKAIHIMCIYYLHEHPAGLTSSELVKYTLEDKGAISRAVKTMQDKGLIDCEACRHNSKINLTDEGNKIAEFINDRSLRAVQAGSANFSDAERSLFYRSLKEISENLEVYYENLIKGKNYDKE